MRLVQCSACQSMHVERRALLLVMVCRQCLRHVDMTFIREIGIAVQGLGASGAPHAAGHCHHLSSCATSSKQEPERGEQGGPAHLENCRRQRMQRLHSDLHARGCRERFNNSVVCCHRKSVHLRTQASRTEGI